MKQNENIYWVDSDVQLTSIAILLNSSVSTLQLISLEMVEGLSFNITDEGGIQHTSSLLDQKNEVDGPHGCIKVTLMSLFP